MAECRQLRSPERADGDAGREGTKLAIPLPTVNGRFFCGLIPKSDDLCGTKRALFDHGTDAGTGRRFGGPDRRMAADWSGPVGSLRSAIRS